ncbi:hypothetical protein [Campylobacter sp.]|uniref:hypothetical protein n=1 Tax=Campylobacter sp. TaxID=205 RepID=UPI002AA8ABA5|nr:hypothetical protein [Campylobacter sp.]
MKKLKTELNSTFKSEYIVLSSFLKVIKKTGKKLLKKQSILFLSSLYQALSSIAPKL